MPKSEDTIQKLLFTLVATSESDRASLAERLGECNTEAVIECVQWHALSGLFYTRVSPYIDCLSEELASGLKKSARKCSMQALRQQRVILHLNQVFRDANLELLFFKGPVLSKLLYDDATLRYAKDIDIWAHPDHAWDAYQLLRSNGFEVLDEQVDINHFSDFCRHTRLYKDVVLLAPLEQVEVELHWRLDKNPYAYSLNWPEAYANRQHIEIGNENIATFSDADYMHYLTAHGSYAMWGRLKWLVDWQAINKRIDLVNNEERSDLSFQFSIASALSNQLEMNHSDGDSFAHTSANWFASVLHTFVAQNQYPPLLIRWCLRLFMSTNWRYPATQCRLACALIVEKVKRQWS